MTQPSLTLIRIGLLLCIGSLAACGGGSDSTTSSTSSSTGTGTGTTGTGTGTGTGSGVLCTYTGSGTQALSYTQGSPNTTPSAVSETLPFSFAWSCSTTTRTLTGNGVPNHDVTGGVFATKVSAQSVSFSIPLAPTQTTTSTSYGGPTGAPAYALNSIKFDPATAGTCSNSATSAKNCNYAGGSDTWQMVALPGSTSNWQFDFGVDTSNAHVQPSGEYHYHGLPTGLIAKLNSKSTVSMTLVGWARDGFPIYTQYGDSSSTTGTSTLPKVVSGWTTKTSPASGRPATTYFPMGHFEQDWEFTGNVSGGLDRCNGHTGATPEFPNGSYHYHITETYPFVQRCVFGKVS